MAVQTVLSPLSSVLFNYIVDFYQYIMAICVCVRVRPCAGVIQQLLQPQESLRQRSEGNESGGMIAEGCPQRARDH